MKSFSEMAWAEVEGEDIVEYDAHPMDDPRYRNGGQGFIDFMNEFVRIPIYYKGDVVPVWTPLGHLPDEEWRPNVSYRGFWELQCDVVREALAMKDGMFKHRQVVFCWSRGEGKSFLAVLVQIWKFMCWNAQTIMLGANSKDQIKFVHFDIIRDIILNSPALSERIGGKKQVQEKEVRRYVGGGQDEVRYNIIRAISSFSGIVSNITGYTFSEIFDMKNLKFYYQLDGSIRNIPNALGVIDSTVSTKDHILYTLYEIYKKNQDDTLFFSYRFSMKGMEVDYWNPQMHQKQLDSYRIKFPPAEFARYFLNTWSSGAASMFTPAQVLSIYYTGTTESTRHRDLMQVLNEKAEILELLGTKRDDDVSSAMNTLDEDTHYNRVRDLDNMLVPVHRMYHVDNNYGIATLEDLNALSTKYDTDFSILMGVDRSDPMALQGARSIFTLVAKGCVGSRHIEYAYKDKQALEYVYFLIGLDIIEPNTLSHMKNLVIRCNEEFDDVDVICSERWGMWDLAEWAETQNIKYEAISSTYDRQRTYFSELYTAVAKGCFKSPFISVPGTRRQDILKEEMEIFIQDDNSRWFGSPEKKARGGIQDDVMFSLGCALFGGLSLTVDDFRLRKTGETGFFFSQEKTVAPY